MNRLFKYLQDALFNNGLAALLTAAGIWIGGNYVISKYQAWQAEREARQQTEAIVERCTQDTIDRKDIEAEAQDAITNDPSNSFINQ